MLKKYFMIYLSSIHIIFMRFHRNVVGIFVCFLCYSKCVFFDSSAFGLSGYKDSESPTTEFVIYNISNTLRRNESFM